MNLSIVIPTLNEQERIENCLASLLLEGEVPATHGVEVLVVDGGSADETVARAQASGARTLQSARGRALQMNAGANVARGDTLLFLHADTLLPVGYRAEVLRVLVRGAQVGAFPLSIDASGGIYRTIERAANVRSRVLGLPYGDQAQFLTRDAFEELGGFPELSAMEDYELMRRATKKFGKPGIAERPVITSARRWQRRGPVKLSLIHTACVGAYWCGASPVRIARWRDGPVSHGQKSRG